MTKDSKFAQINKQLMVVFSIRTVSLFSMSKQYVDIGRFFKLCSSVVANDLALVKIVHMCFREFIIDTKTKIDMYTAYV